MEKLSIGIDLGHGETAAAIPRENAQQEYSVARLITAKGNMQVIPTQIILTNAQMEKLKGQTQPTYGLLKGMAPFQIGACSSYVEDGERFFYFKVAPKDFDKPCGTTPTAKACGITHGMVMACFVFALVENIFFYNQDVLLQNKRFEAELLVGCPTTTDWTDNEAQNAYMELVKKATGVNHVRIIPESRAAMFSSIENSENNISAANGAVIFDFGSSTADCTYMLLGRKILEFSWTLGAFEVERMMMLEALNEAIRQNGVFDPDEDKLLEVADSLRTAKESYYNGMYPPKGKSIFCEFLEAETGEIIESAIKIGQPFMDRVTGECETDILCDSTVMRSGSWQALCKAFFQEAKKQIETSTYKDDSGKEHTCTVSTVVITGGASKMDFIEPLCKEVYPDCTVILNKSNPSHTVSNGLSWIAITDSNLPACKTAVINQVMGKGVTKKLVNNLSAEVFKAIKQIAIKEVNTWANQPGDTATLADLQKQIEATTSKPETKEQIAQICNKVIDEWKLSVGVELENAINSQAQKLYSDQVAKSLMLPKDILKELDGNTLDTSIDTQSLLDGIDFSSTMRTLFTAIIQITIWVVAVLLAMETFGLSLLAAWLFCPSGASDKDMNKPRKQATRQKISSQLGEEMDKKKDEIMKSFNENLAKQTDTLQASLEPMVDGALAIVTLQQFSL